MNGSKVIWSALLGCALLVGCDDKTETPSGNPAPVPQASEAAAEKMKSKTEDASERAKDAAPDKAAKGQAEAASDALKKGADSAADAVGANPAAAEATTKLQQVMDYIRDKKWDLAESTLAQVEKNQASLPAAVQAQVGNARSMLDAAKKGAAAVPAVPATPAIPAAPTTPAVPAAPATPAAPAAPAAP